MSASRDEVIADLKAYLRTIQKPNRPVDSITETDRLVASGLIDSLAIVQIVTYLETRHGIDFTAGGLDPDRLATIAGIADIILENRA
jgi:acyl carrier protein